MKTINLTPYKGDYFSQFGEDGVVEALFNLMGINNGILVEVGAWDGVYLSNTHYHAQRNAAFKRLLIESEKDRFDKMTQTIPWTENNILLNLLVEAKGENSLNEIFSKYIKSEPVALLSIDVDGEDLKLWESLDTTKFRPAVVIIENGSWKSPAALTKLSKAFSQKGYNIVFVTGNFIFIDEKYNIKATETIHKLIRASSHDEYTEYFGTVEGEQLIEVDED